MGDGVAFVNLSETFWSTQWVSKFAVMGDGVAFVNLSETFWSTQWVSKFAGTCWARRGMAAGAPEGRRSSGPARAECQFMNEGHTGQVP